MNRQGLIIIIFVFVTAFLVWRYFMPALNEVLLLRASAQRWQEELSNTQALRQKLNELKNKYDTIISEADRVAQAVTKKEDLPGLLVQFEQLSSQNGLILDSVAFSYPDEKKEKKVTAPSTSAKTLTADLVLSGSQNSLLSFLKAVENNLRIMDVASISFSESDGSVASGQSLRVSLSVYHME